MSQQPTPDIQTAIFSATTEQFNEFLRRMQAMRTERIQELEASINAQHQAAAHQREQQKALVLWALDHAKANQVNIKIGADVIEVAPMPPEDAKTVLALEKLAQLGAQSIEAMERPGKEAAENFRARMDELEAELKQARDLMMATQIGRELKDALDKANQAQERMRAAEHDAETTEVNRRAAELEDATRSAGNTTEMDGNLGPLFPCPGSR